MSVETNYGGAAVGRDGTIYQGTFDHRLLAVAPNGSVKWSVPTASILESTPAILPDGRIAFVDDSGTLYVVNPDGSPSWRFRSGTSACCNETSPAIGPDGTIYTGIDETVYAFGPDGSMKWVHDLGRPITGPISMSSQGKVYAPAQHLFALGSDGTLLWDWTPTNFAVAGSAAIASNGVVYANSFGPSYTLWILPGL